MAISCLSRLYSLLQIFNWPKRQHTYSVCMHMVCLWYEMYGGEGGGLAQYFAKAEVGNSLCILAFLQETNIIFWDIKGLFVVSSLAEKWKYG